MTDRKSDERSPVRTLGASKDRPRFLQIFDELRRRPSRSRDRALRRMASRATRRHVPERGALQRGDLAEPPPVLDLVLDRDSDRARVRSMLVESCAVGPVWTLPLGDPTAAIEVEKDQEHAENPSRSRPAKRSSLRRSRLLSRWSRPAPDEVVRPAPAPPLGEREAPEADVTTDQLYELIGSLVDGGFAWRAGRSSSRHGAVVSRPRHGCPGCTPSCGCTVAASARTRTTVAGETRTVGWRTTAAHRSR